ncbi:MFS general substrate transporter [Rhizodiscina lignyota]|uniref:MFS general substrate transporter n=1 Tax=Rhizodiscina lignyota TaxID=1504668 RepID=A0A9P4I8G3_9PEZI|nr:MFS general substrate transporter [Rhizodiscina lignyota]
MAEKERPDGTDVESGQGQETIRHWTMLLDQGVLTPSIMNHTYDGKGTEDDPFVVTWIENDPRNPLRFPQMYKWMITITMGFATLSVSFCSSAYTGGIPTLMEDFGSGEEVTTLGLALFVLGFAIGPLFWAPLSELYGRQILYITTFGAFAAFNAATTGAKNIWTIIILRFFAGSFGSSPLTNAGGVIADMFSARERGLAMSIFSAAPFLGPVLGPIIGGFLGETERWVWVMGLTATFSGAVWMVGTCLAPETYPPVLLRKRAAKLSKVTGKVYKTRQDIEQGKIDLVELFKTSMSRPWILLIMEPIVLLLSIYMAIVYGTLYLLFGAFPVVYQEGRGWSQGVGGLPFLGVMIGMLLSVTYNIVVDNRRYLRAVEKSPGGFAPPEARLPPCMIAAIMLPIGLFWFAWTNYPSIHWLASVAAGVPFGFGMVLVFLGIMNYLIDAYTIFAASVLAANGVIRSIFGAVFPLFTTQMYANLGIHWASTIPAFLALLCLPFPFLFYKYGGAIRARCKYSKEADEFMKKLRGQLPEHPTAEELEIEENEEQDAADFSYEDESHLPRFEKIRSGTSANGPGAPMLAMPGSEYEANPFDLDRVNTRESFKSQKTDKSHHDLKRHCISAS